MSSTSSGSSSGARPGVARALSCPASAHPLVDVDEKGRQVEDRRLTRPTTTTTERGAHVYLRTHDSRLHATVTEMPDPAHPYSPAHQHDQAEERDIQEGLAANDDHAEHPDPGEVDHFALAHGDSHTHARAQEPLNWRHLFKRPIVRQWLYKGKLYKSSVEREATYVELFFDLMFVGIIHQLAEAALDPVSGVSVFKFGLAFYPAWSVWSDVRTFVNHSGVDDVPQRLYLLATMLCLAGYSAMVSSVTFVPAPGSDAPEPTPPEETVHIHSRDVLAESGFDYVLSPDFHTPLRAAAAFLFVAKALRIILYHVYAWALPNFRWPFILFAYMMTIPCFICLPIIWVTNIEPIAILIIISISAERSWPFLIGIASKISRLRGNSLGRDWYMPANAVEHSMERNSLFITLILGEFIINSTYAVTAGDGQVGLSPEYGRSALSIFTAFALMCLYFDADSSRAYIHATRRHWLTAVACHNLHWPLVAALVLASAATRELVLDPEPEQALLWYYDGGLALALLVLALLGWLHLSLDAPHTSLLPRNVRLWARIVVAVFFATCPLYFHSSLAYLGTHAGVLALLITFETVGKLGSESIDVIEVFGEHPTQDERSAEEGKANGSTAESREEQKGKAGIWKRCRQKGQTEHSKWSRFNHGVMKEDLTEAERGELDLGVEAGLEKVEVRDLKPYQVLAYRMA